MTRLSKPGNHPRRRSRSAAWTLLAALLLWAFFAQAVTSMVVKSPTVDERVQLTRGYVYLELGDLRFTIGHPILAGALNALPLWALTDLSLPTDHPAWAEHRGTLFADRFIWHSDHNADSDPHAADFDADRGRSSATSAASVELIFFLGRLMTVVLGMLFAALVFRWARQLWGGWGGIVALTLVVFDPTIVAHSQFTTDDIAVSFFYFAATYGLWCYLETGRPRDMLATGVAFGLAQGAKFSASLLVPVLLVLIGLWPFLKRVRASESVRSSQSPPLSWIQWLRLTGGRAMAIFVIGGLTLWAIYRFEFHALPEADAFPSGHPLAGWRWPLPAPPYWKDFFSFYGERERYAFLSGRISFTGWWYYFPFAFLIKTPIPALLLIGRALIVPGARANAKSTSAAPAGSREFGGRHVVALLVPAAVYLLFTLLSPIQIGYRHFIPVLPYLYVLAGRGIDFRGMGRGLRKKAALWVRFAWPWALVVWSATVALWIHPHYLAYFNALAGGPDNGWRYLVDSNIDWGQDLPALRDVVERHDLGRIKLSYFGSTPPSHYGLDFEPLPTWSETPEQGNPLTRTYYPHHPAPGVYAISATHLQGVVLEPDRWDTYAWFRDREPFAKAGYSIFLYRVEPTGPPVDVALWGLQVDELAPETFSSFGSNDVRLRWFDGRTSLVIPAQPSWYVVVDGDEMAEWGWEVPVPCATVDGRGCRLYPPDAEAHAGALDRVEELSAGAQAWHSAELVPALEGESGAVSALALPVDVGGQVEFLGYAGQGEVGQPAACFAKRGCKILTAWRVTAPVEEPRAIFVHLLTEDGEVAAQWDGLDVPVEGWREGDIILQEASFDLPADLPLGRYWLQVGIYNPETMERLPVLVDGTPLADRILLETVRVGDLP